MLKKILLFIPIFLITTLFFGCFKPSKKENDVLVDGYIFVATPSRLNKYYSPFFGK